MLRDPGAVAAVQRGVGGDALVANAGGYDTGISDDVRAGGRSLLNNPTVDSASINLRRSFHDRVEGVAHLSWLNNQGRS